MKHCVLAGFHAVGARLRLDPDSIQTVYIDPTRRDKRRTHYKAVVPTVVTCSNCGAAVLYHRVCPECGFYRGKLAIEKKAAE